MTLRSRLDDTALYSSDYIYDEVVTLALSRKVHDEALKLSDYLLRSDIQIIRVVPPVFESAVELFRDYPVSFTDCTSVALMREIGVKRIATFDSDFERFDGG